MTNLKLQTRNSASYPVLMAALLLQSTHTPLAHADEPAPPTQPAKPTVGVKIQKYPTIRVGDIAPEFTLPSGQRFWSSRDRLGRRAILMMVVNLSPNLTKEGYLHAVDSIKKARERVQANGADPIVISSALPLQGLYARPDFELFDRKQDFYKLFSPGPMGLTLVAIDKAGFIRRIDAMHNLEVGAMMQYVGDPTPKLEVGKPAPDFSVVDMNGQVRRLADLRGQKNLLLTFFPKCFTGG